ncbi:hypothetical protein FHT76_001736 [Rhizobium sp. BK176]|nr:hypothetical protein [Rhizobium sp. BK176]
MTDGRDERHHVRVQRFVGGHVVRVDGVLLHNGRLYGTHDMALGALKEAWGKDIRLKSV